VLALLGWGVLAGGLIGALAQLPRLAWAVQTVLPGYFPRSAEVDWECLRAALYCLVWAGAAVAGPGLRWRRRWSLDLLLAVGVAYLLVTAAATIVAAGGWAGAHGELPWPASLPPYPYCVLPLTGVALKAGLACLALFWLWRFRREFSLPPSAPD
jgi:hypothetical protein